MKNLHQSYYKDYFKEIDFKYLINDEKAPDNEVDKIKRQNKDLTSGEYASTDRKLTVIPKLPSDDKHFKEDKYIKIPLEVMYPGLVTGIGIKHETNIKGEFKLGMHFDWTWGMPVIYGSSVKGVLKSAFKEGYVDETLVDKARVPRWVANESNKVAIIKGIFEGKNCNDENIPIYERDIFFDAVIVKADPKGRILCSDSITPHGDNPLKNPIPITFLKIAPGCEIKFRFRLDNSDFGEGKTLTAEQKKALFEEILKTVGVGAKTNVGYGQLKESNEGN